MTQIDRRFSNEPRIEGVLRSGLLNQDGPTPAHSPDLGPCWIWQGVIDKNGYGRLSTRTRKGALAHRFIYAEMVGDIPIGLQLDHLCVVTACVNPAHLEPVTGAENNRRRFLRAGYDPDLACPRGHRRTAESVYVTPQGRKNCRPCLRATAARIRSEKKAA